MLPAAWMQPWNPCKGAPAAETQSSGESTKPKVVEFSQPRFDELCRRLADERFQVRESAQEELHKMLHQTPADRPNPIEAACYEAWARTSDPEVRIRLEEVLTDFAVNLWGPEPSLGVSVVIEKAFNEEGKMVSRLRVQTVSPGSGAEEAGVKTGDFIVGMDDMRLEGEADAKAKMASMLGERKPRDRVALKLSRNGEVMNVRVVLGHSAWVKSKPGDEKPAAPPDPQHCFRVYIEKKKTGR
jgi:C-terminal processing protease CtpA/Prc